MADYDYEELSDKTIDEIKNTVKDKEVDLKKLLKAEKNNKDRKTLKKWLKSRIEDHKEQEKEKKAAEKEEKRKQKSKRKKRKPGAGKSMWKQPKTLFLVGLVIGIAVGASALYTSDMAGPQDTLSEQQAVSQTEAYFMEQLGDGPTNVTVATVDGSTYEDLYVLTMDVETAQQNLEREVYMTKHSGLIFVNTLLGGSPPIDGETKRPIGSQAANQQ